VIISKVIKLRVKHLPKRIQMGSKEMSHSISEIIAESRENIFGPKWNEVTGGCRRLHNEELHNLYSSPSIIRIIK
jgi:hypothetical protein